MNDQNENVVENYNCYCFEFSKKNYCRDEVVGHSTQFVWNSAQKIACALSTSQTFDGRKWNSTWLGNMEGEPVYIAGLADSQ